jgi:acyl-CoA hydrolase
MHDTFSRPGMIEYIIQAVTPPDTEGFVNLGPNCDIALDLLWHFARTGQAKIIFEINSHVPWVHGHKDYNDNRIHLSWAESIFENHDPLPQLPPIEVTETEDKIAQNVLAFIENGDTIQLGFGGIPNCIAGKLRDRRGLKLHSEFFTDGIVDLVASGAVNNRGKPYMDGLTVGTFAAGTDKLYDWLDRNPEVVLLPVRSVNDPQIIAQTIRMKSINSGLMVDLHGQVCSDAIGFHQVTGIGGQLEFVMGAQRSEGGRSILCLRSTSRVGRRRLSNVVISLPPGSAVTVPRHFADTIVTEWGAAEIKDLDAIGRARALIEIAHPDFRSDLIRKAKAVGLWEHRPGFASFKQRVMFNNLGYLRHLKQSLAGASRMQRVRFLFGEIRRALAGPERMKRFRAFLAQNRAWGNREKSGTATDLTR